MAGPGTLYQEGDHASRPASGAGCVLYACTDHGLIYRDDGSAWSTWATLAPTAAVVPFTPAGSIAATNVQDAIEEVASEAGVGGGAADPIATIFGTPDTAFEFDTSSFTGLTALGSPSAEDADTTVPDHYYVRRIGSGVHWAGRYVAPPVAPWTAITRVEGYAAGDFNDFGMFLGEATPGAMDSLAVARGGGVRSIISQRFTNPTTFGSNIVVAGQSNVESSALYLAMRVTTATNVDYLFSFGGHVWVPLVTARNPAITIGSVGIGVKADSASVSMAAAFDFLRIWNSAKTFPGI